jgi:hypothetical protein
MQPLILIALVVLLSAGGPAARGDVQTKAIAAVDALDGLDPVLLVGGKEVPATTVTRSSGRSRRSTSPRPPLPPCIAERRDRRPPAHRARRSHRWRRPARRADELRRVRLADSEATGRRRHDHHQDDVELPPPRAAGTDHGAAGQDDEFGDDSGAAGHVVRRRSGSGVSDAPRWPPQPSSKTSDAIRSRCFERDGLPPFKAVALGATTVDGVSVDQVRVISGVTDVTLALEASGRIHSMTFRDRNMEGEYGTFTSRATFNGQAFGVLISQRSELERVEERDD